MRLLMALAERPGEVVLSNELLDTVWKGVIVTPSSLYQSVAQLRQLLGDSVTEPRYIETVPRKGYRLVAPVLPLPAHLRALSARMRSQSHYRRLRVMGGIDQSAAEAAPARASVGVETVAAPVTPDIQRRERIWVASQPDSPLGAHGGGTAGRPQPRAHCGVAVYRPLGRAARSAAGERRHRRRHPHIGSASRARGHYL